MDNNDISIVSGGFDSNIKIFTDESINNVKKSLFKLKIISSSPDARPVLQKDMIFDVYCKDKAENYYFIWDNSKYVKNLEKHGIFFDQLIEMISHIDLYGIAKSFDTKHSNNEEKRWIFQLYIIPETERDFDEIGMFVKVTYTMRFVSIYNDNRNFMLMMRFISARYDSCDNIKKFYPSWWQKEIIDRGKEDLIEESKKKGTRKKLESCNDPNSKKFYTRVIDTFTKKEYEEMLSFLELNDQNIMVMQENNLQTVEELSDYYAERVDWCKLYGFDEEIDSYSDFSNECANRIKLFNLKNSVAFNRSVMKVRDAGIHLPDVRLSYECWPDYARLRNLIETGGDQKEILRLFPIVFAEYVVMPGDVDTTDPDIERYTTIAGVPKHVYLDNSLPMNAYTKDKPWNIEIGKQWLKDRQMALLENKDR